MFKIDKTFKLICFIAAAIVGILMLGFFIQLFASSSGIWQKFGFKFITSSNWDSVDNLYGALPSIVGTLITSTIALVISLPLAIFSSLFIVDCRDSIGAVLGSAIDLLAAIPSVIYGMWGLFVLAPLMQEHVQVFLVDTLHLNKLPFVSDEFNGFGLLTASLILAIMILPYMCAIMRDVFKMTPPMLKEAAYGIGCTKFETNKDIILKYGIRGILGGIFIGLGRALGETMAVLFVIGNMMEMPTDIFSGATTIATTLANNFAEADGLQRQALFALGLILLLMSFAVQLFSQYYLHLTRKKRGEHC